LSAGFSILRFVAILSITIVPFAFLSALLMSSKDTLNADGVEIATLFTLINLQPSLKKDTKKAPRRRFNLI
jgi:hypothetical protein